MASFSFVILTKNDSWAGQNSIATPPPIHPTDKNCASCHQAQWQDWNNSHHQKAMQIADDKTVLGDFNDTEVALNNSTSRFYKKGEEFWVTTENKDYKIDYAFGFEPLQQYLIKMDNGKYQVLPLSWDSRPVERGGQRWFNIYGEEHIPENDRLHFLQPMQNWNGMCADCHSSGLKRNYDPEQNKFDTSWDDINVSCASCHTGEITRSTSDDLGWILEAGQNTMQWNGDKRDQSEIEICAACHSRRTPLTDGFTGDEKFLDAFSPSPILSPEYFPDGQVRDEDYVWGSFLQSKMHEEGVICSDCHDPHSLQLKASGNGLCTQCHLPAYYDRVEHFNHPVGSSGAQCVNCHMPARTYMGVDDRRDHSFRIPRPDLNHKTASPDACTTCHTDQQPAWAAAQINNWFDGGQNRDIHYGEILNAVFTGEAGGEQKLHQLINDEQVPAIIRGSAYSLLTSYPSATSFDHIKQGLISQEPLIRLGAVRGSIFIPTAERSEILLPLLSDEMKAVRVEVVRVLSDIAPEQIDGTYSAAYKSAKQEFFTASNQTTWRGEGHFNLGLFQGAQNNRQLAEQHYRKAIEVDPYFPASYINLADLFRAFGEDASNAEMIESGLSVLPENADLNYSKALNLIRNRQAEQAMTFLEKANSLAPGNAYYAYVYAVALKDLGQPGRAMEIIISAILQSENDGNLNMMLFNIYAESGRIKEAIKVGNKLLSLFPQNEQIIRAVTNLKNRP
ncbi:MAG: hypothetical protein HOH18_05320 [Kordiimonadaceae bacterium]|nr:hypothetical protein [Kordiimonadaceae bacterium]MBT6035878.1 hypothetical protein [Kordiimonadaceae bacterium]MBT7581616.1 hypothetical protein [Kordiimonadaceae bacterium]